MATLLPYVHIASKIAYAPLCLSAQLLSPSILSSTPSQRNGAHNCALIVRSTPNRGYVGRCAAILGYTISCIIYNLFFHPLAGFPGPWWAAVSHFHEFYGDVVQGGRFWKQMEAMHAKYGPIIRINPREIHVSDPAFYDEIYTKSSRKRDKDPKHTAFTNSTLSMVATADHEHHRLRRSILNRFFSKQAVRNLESVIQDKICRLADRLKELQADGKIIDLHHALTSCAQDIISQYAYGQTFGHLEDPEFNSVVHKSFLGFLRFAHIARFFPFLFPAMRCMPKSLAKKLNPAVSDQLEHRAFLADFAARTLKTRKSGENFETNRRHTIFEALTDPNLPAEERTVARIEDEAWIVNAGASETTSRTMTALLYYVFHDKTVLTKLREELVMAMPSELTKPSLAELEVLPYLNAVISEGLRLSFGATMRLPRIPTGEALAYKDWVIPPGTPVSSSPLFLNVNPDLYPDPWTFRPERWLEAGKKGDRLPLFTFGRGTRMCLGINLAYAELYLMTATIIRWFDVQPVDSKLEHFVPYRDLTLGMSKDYYFGMKVKVVGMRT